MGIFSEINNDKFKYFKDSGYFRFTNNNFFLIGDIGKIGPNYLPGHSHADTLSFEMSINKERVIVNSGTSIYGNNDERLKQRGTSSHSTLSINNKNSSEVWSSFRTGRRAFPQDIKLRYSFLISVFMTVFPILKVPPFIIDLEYFK